MRANFIIYRQFAKLVGQLGGIAQTHIEPTSSLAFSTLSFFCTFYTPHSVVVTVHFHCISFDQQKKDLCLWIICVYLRLLVCAPVCVSKKCPHQILVGHTWSPLILKLPSAIRNLQVCFDHHKYEPMKSLLALKTSSRVGRWIEKDVLLGASPVIVDVLPEVTCSGAS